MTCIVSNSAEILINFLLDMGLAIPRLQQCPYYMDITESKYMVMLHDISSMDDPTHFDKIQTHVARYDSTTLFLSDDHSMFDHKGEVGAILQKLIPMHPDKGQTYSNLIFLCRGQEILRNGVDTLFRLAIKNIRAAKVQHGDSELYLLWASDIQTPTVLSKFLHTNRLSIFYPVLSSAFGIWMEWGWRYDFNDPLFHRIFQRKETESVFVFKDGNKISIPIGLLDFVPLIKFIELKFSHRAQTSRGEPRQFNTPEFEYKLRLKSDTSRTWRRQEMENLLLQEREIRQRIEWLRDIESIFEEEIVFKVLFYPFSENRRDPIFPHYFFRNHSLNQLRQLKCYYGEMGTLGEGALVCGKNFIGRNDRDVYEISGSLYPRSGMVFQSNPDWWAKAGLRVMTPVGFDLFPYLDVDTDDREAIVEAFIDTAVWGIRRTREGAIREKAKNYLREQARSIKENLQEYLYFVFPRQDEMHMDWEKAPLEGIVIYEKEFRDFDIKIANLGIHFAMNNEEQNIANEELKSTVVHNISERFENSVAILRGHLEQSFQNERESLKNEIDRFIDFVKEKEKAIESLKDPVDKSFRNIKTKESIIKGYEGFLGKRAGEYTWLLKKSSRHFGAFTSEISNFMSQLNKHIDAIFKDNEKQHTDQLKFLKDIQSDAGKTKKELRSLLEKREKSSNALTKLGEIQNQFAAQFDSRERRGLELKENIEELWNVNNAFKGLDKYLSQIHGHLTKVKSISHRGNIYSVAPHYTLIEGWFDEISGRTGDLRSQWKRDATGNGNVIGKLLDDLREPVKRCFQDIEKSINLLKERKYRHSHKKESYQEISKYVTKLRNRIKKLDSLLLDSLLQ